MSKQNYVENIKEALGQIGIQNLLNDYQKFFPPYPARFNKPVLKNILTATAAEVHEFGQKLGKMDMHMDIILYIKHLIHWWNFSLSPGKSLLTLHQTKTIGDAMRR